LGPMGHRPPKSCPGPPNFLDTVVLLLVELIGSIVISLKFRLAVVASQMMRGQAPQIFFPRTAPGHKQILLFLIVRYVTNDVSH